MSFSAQLQNKLQFMTMILSAVEQSQPILASLPGYEEIKKMYIPKLNKALSC
jgi:hypothetical protein